MSSPTRRACSRRSCAVLDSLILFLRGREPRRGRRCTGGGPRGIRRSRHRKDQEPPEYRGGLRVTEIPEGRRRHRLRLLTSDTLFDAIHARGGRRCPALLRRGRAHRDRGEHRHGLRLREASRYGKGTADYINCPFSREEYDAFWNALTTAEGGRCTASRTPRFRGLHAHRGQRPAPRAYDDTLRFGIPQADRHARPQDRKRPLWAVLLADNANGTLYNLVGCQTHLKFGEQKRVFSMIPGA